MNFVRDITLGNNMGMIWHKRSGQRGARMERAPFVVAALCVAVATLGSLLWRVSAGSGAPDGPTARPQVVPVAASAPLLKIMPMGDSITAGYNSDATGGYRLPLQKKLTAEGYRFDFVGSQITHSTGLADPEHEGYDGKTVAFIADNVAEQEVKKFQPDVILLMIGTNDLIPNPQTYAFLSVDYPRLLTKIFEAKPDVRVIVAPALYNRVTDSTITDNFNLGGRITFDPVTRGKGGLNSIVASFKEKGRAISWAGEMSAANTNSEKDLPDGVHPSPAIYEAMADAWLGAIKSAVPLKGAAPAAPTQPKIAPVQAPVAEKPAVVTPVAASTEPRVDYSRAREQLQRDATLCVSPDGDDGAPGTIARPFKTLRKAQEAVRALNATMTGDIVVAVRGGTYRLAQPLRFDERDGGFNKHRVVYQGYPGERVVVSGGVKVQNWTAIPGSKTWRAEVPEVSVLRELYVNGRRAERAGGVNLKSGRHLAWWSAKGDTDHYKADGFVADDPDGKLLKLGNKSDLEIYRVSSWKDAYLKVEDIVAGGAGRVIIKMKQPYFRNALTTRTLGVTLEDEKLDLVNAREFLDQPGQWYFDAPNKTVYYQPREGESLDKAEVVAPRSEGLLVIAGRDLTHKVTNLEFRGLTFSDDAWLLPSREGLTIIQSVQCASGPNSDADDQDGLQIPGGVQVDFARGIRFERCVWRNTGAVALAFSNGVEDCGAVGNVFRDVSSSAITVGLWHQDKLKPGEDNPKRILLSNNFIRNAAAEYLGSTGIQTFYTHDVQILHNDVADLPYSGIAAGWGWGRHSDNVTLRRTTLSYNRVLRTVKRLADGSGIYLLENQPGSEMHGNYSDGMLYFDQGSSFWNVSDNVIDGYGRWLNIWQTTMRDIKLDNNYSFTGDMTNVGTRTPVTRLHVVPDGNWPDEAWSIIANSGVEDRFRDIAPELQLPPTVAQVEVVDATTTRVRFSAPVERASALRAENYALSGSARVEGAALQPNRVTVLLKTSPLEENRVYTLAARNVRGIGGELLASQTPARLIYGRGDGLKAEYFSDSNLKNLKQTRVDEVVDFDWDRGAPCSGINPEHFSARWSGHLKPLATGDYTFTTRCDNGTRLSVNGQKIIDQWNGQGINESRGHINLQAGRSYDIKMEYFQDGWTAAAHLMWQSPSQPREVVPRSQLYSH